MSLFCNNEMVRVVVVAEDSLSLSHLRAAWWGPGDRHDPPCSPSSLLHCCHCSGHSLMLAFNPGHQMSAGRADTTPPHTPPATIVIRLEYNNWVWRSVNHTTTTELYWHSSCNVISVMLSWKHHLQLHLNIWISQEIKSLYPCLKKKIFSPIFLLARGQRNQREYC